MKTPKPLEARDKSEWEQILYGEKNTLIRLSDTAGTIEPGHAVSYTRMQVQMDLKISEIRTYRNLYEMLRGEEKLGRDHLAHPQYTEIEALPKLRELYGKKDLEFGVSVIVLEVRDAVSHA